MQKTENVISKSIFSTSALLLQPSDISPQTSALFPSSLTIIQTNV
nr:hypothetical protein [uncultured Prevotella sp.]